MFKFQFIPDVDNSKLSVSISAPAPSLSASIMQDALRRFAPDAGIVSVELVDRFYVIIAPVSGFSRIMSVLSNEANSYMYSRV